MREKSLQIGESYMRAIQQIEYIVNMTPVNDTNHRVAETIYDNLYRLQRLSLADLAELCFVSTSTLMRFLKAAGYASYPLFQAAIREAVSDFEYRSVYIPRPALKKETGTQALLDVLIAELSQLRDDLDEQSLGTICRAMHGSERVVFGGMNGVSTLDVTVLRSALCLTGKKTRLLEGMIPKTLEDFVFSPGDFCFFIKAESPGSRILDDLIVRAKAQGGRVLVISNARNFTRCDDCDFTLCFDGKLAYVDHYSMQALIAMLAITYRELYMEEIRRAGK